MSVPAADHALCLPWLAPAAASLVTLARKPGADAWPALRHDPAAVLLVVRAVIPETPVRLEVLDQPIILETALHGLTVHHPCDFASWSDPAIAPLHQCAVAHGQLSAALARTSRRYDAETAYVAGLLAPLSWLAVAAVDPTACAGAVGSARTPAWGMSPAALGRRLATRWRLPEWLFAIVGHLEMPTHAAATVGCDPALFACVQLAAALLDRAGAGLHLAGQRSIDDLAGTLGLRLDQLEDLTSKARLAAPRRVWGDPSDMPLLTELLTVAIENRRLRAGPVLEPLHRRLDRLHGAVIATDQDAAERLRVAKMSALAELAAGAGHEINNPLAVISGQAQYLLSHEEDEERLASLEGIVRQTRRVHDVLNGLMQFARPPRPVLRPVALAEVVQAVVQDHRSDAEKKSLQVQTQIADVHTEADAAQVRTIVTALLRNAIEAAPEGGWVRITLDGSAELARLVVEDNGPGVSASQREHLFDPFFSGRTAGRGRGLGLSTAWQLARQMNGEVAFEPTPGGPTRFVFRLSPNGAAQRRCA